MRQKPLRHAALFLVASALASCGTPQVRDTNPAVDANPLCASQPSQPGEPVSTDCERKTEVNWSSGDSKASEPIDFGKKH